MTGVFACPECGTHVEPAGLPGRQVRCPGCRTLLEVPFIPRTVCQRRRKKSKRLKARVRLGFGIAFAAILVLGGATWVRNRDRGASREELQRLIASSQEAERGGRLDRALVEVTAALELVRRQGLNPPEDLAGRRDDLSRREAAAQLDKLGGLPPDEALGRALTLKDRARHDPALAGLAGRIDEALAAARSRKARTALTAAREALSDGRDEAALRQATEALAQAERLPAGVAKPIQDESYEIMTSAVERVGVVVGPPRGRFFLGSAGAYGTDIQRPVIEALKARGYVMPPSPSWKSLWERHAPYRFTIDAAETPEPYLQSANRGSRIEVRLALLRQETPLWSAILNGRTRTPPPTMAAFEAGLLATSTRRDPSAEHRLYNDALGQVLDRLPNQLKTLPAPRP
jgi:hypothetical protein